MEGACMNENVYVLLLAGGGGTRLWPKSTEALPKQFLKLYKDKTLLRLTAERIQKLVEWDHIFVITNTTQLADVVRELPELDLTHIITEPMKRDTAMAMAVGALVIQQHNPNAVIMNFASDHVVEDEDEFLRVMHHVAETAEKTNELISVGIHPTFPHTGYGYIQRGQQQSKEQGKEVFEVKRFKEKPDKETAEHMLETGEYYWNANMYTWSATSIMHAFQKHSPEIYTILQKLTSHFGQENWQKALEEAYEQVPSKSIDYAISEKVEKMLLIAGDFGWNDVGDWNVVYQLGDKNAEGNVVFKENDAGGLIVQDANNNLVHIHDKLIAAVGIKDLVIIDTKDVLLVMPRALSQDVKKIVTALKEQNKKEYL
jgi:mannose-1-phosphate guanylyltransferase